MTFEEAEKLHKELWGWLAETGSEVKFDAPILNGRDILNGCFCCEIAGWDDESEDMNCIYDPSLCPITWVDDNDSFSVPCESQDSPYRKWRFVETLEDRKHWAAIIRDLPWRK